MGCASEKWARVYQYLFFFCDGRRILYDRFNRIYDASAGLYAKIALQLLVLSKRAVEQGWKQIEPRGAWNDIGRLTGLERAARTPNRK